MENLVEYLKDKLWNLDTQRESKNETSYATSFGIKKCFERIFAKCIHIIIQKHEMNTDEEAKDTEDAEKCWLEVADIIKMTQRKLIKPIVALFSFKSGDRIGLNILNESHWQILVIFWVNLPAYCCSFLL